MAVAADYNALVQTLYVSYFGRPADTFGLENFSNQLAALNAPTDLVELNEAVQTNAGLKNLINSFSGSKEAENLYGTGDTVAFVSAIYQNLLGRSPAFEGLKFWVNAINSGALARGNASLAIAAATTTNETPQGVLDAQRIANKVAVAEAFTTAIDTGEELAAYSGATAAATARSLLSQVTPTTDPAAFQANVNATLEKLVDISNPGVTVNLLVSADTQVGGSGKDVFNAFSANPVSGADATTLSSFDSIDGGAGRDTLNIYSKAGININQAGTISNVEVINVFNESGTNTNQFGGTTGVDAGKFVGATEVWQVGFANDVINLGPTQTAGFRNTTNDALTVAASGAAASIALDQVSGATATNILDVNVSGTALASVTLTGTLNKADPANTAAATATLDVTAGKDVTGLTVNTNINSTLTVTEDLASTKKVDTLTAGASTGGITFDDADFVSLTTGSGADTLTIRTATVAAATGVTAVSGVVNSGSGNDTVNVRTTGAGLTTIDTGTGNDTVEIFTRGSGKLTVSLGDGADTFKSAVDINGTDMIDAGAGSDTLLLSLVGAANIGAFSNFDAFDLAGLGTKTLDVDILASKNTVSEFVASAAIGGTATLSNVGTAGFRSTADLTGDIVVVNQKTAAALTITVDADETGTADVTGEVVGLEVQTNAKSVNAVFDSSYLANIATEPTPVVADNVTTLTLTAAAATAVTVTSGGANSSNVLNFTGAEATSLTITGASKLTVGTTVAAKLATIDASGATGGTVVSTSDLKALGTIKLGSGTDLVTVDSSIGGNVETISGFEKAAAAAVGADVAAANAAQADADVISFAGVAAVRADGALGGLGTVSKGVLTFSGAGPSDLATAVTAIQGVTAVGEVVAFEILGTTYVVNDNGQIAALTGVSGVTQIGEVGATDTFFIV